MIKRLINLFKTKTREPLKPFAVEAKLMLDENTEITSFVALIHAKSKKDAKFQITNRAYVKAGAVANKAAIQKFTQKKKP